MCFYQIHQPWRASRSLSIPHIFRLPLRLSSMAASVRQLINLPSLSAYIESTVPEIKLPISVKQVRSLLVPVFCEQLKLPLTLSPKHSLATGSPIRLISSLPQTTKDLFCERSLQASCSRKQHIRSSASTE